MKRTYIFILLCFLGMIVKSQTTLYDDSLETSHNPIKKRHEFAYSLITVNSTRNLALSEPNTNKFETLNGVLFRYKFNQFSLRLNASYSYKKIEKYYEFNCIECIHGDSETKDYKLGGGLQFSFFKKQDYIYSFIDINYRKRNEIINLKNSSFIEVNNHTSNKINGIEGIIGIGIKLKLVRNIYISAETGYDAYYAKNKQYTDNIVTQEEQHVTSNYNYENFLGKLYLSMTF